jgi:SAM-dependent methyltransferase
LQLLDVPESLSRFYPSNYYSFREDTTAEPAKGFHGWLARQRNETLLRLNPIGAVLSRIKPLDEGWRTGLDKYLHFSALREFGITFSSRVLDVGCGAGSLLKSMALFGFRRLAGCDPFIEHDLASPGVCVLKSELEAMEGPFDLVMLHHAFEHMADPGEVLRDVRRLLSPDGVCLIRIPVADSAAFERYRENWVQLDAPRHLFLHSRKSIEQLSAVAGMTVQRIIHDSSAFQFWGSELYLRDIPLMKGNDMMQPSLLSDIFPGSLLHDWDLQAEQLNRGGRGDQAAFLLTAV